MRTNILELSIFLAFALKYATSYSYSCLKIKVGFGVRMAFFLPVHCTLELVPGKVTLLPVLDSGKKKEEILVGTSLLVQLRFGIC